MTVRMLRRFPGDARNPLGVDVNSLYNGPLQDYFLSIGWADRKLELSPEYSSDFAGVPEPAYARGRLVNNQRIWVPISTTGVLFTVARQLDAASTFSLAAGSDANLTISSGGAISATAGLAASANQIAIVTETPVAGSGAKPVTYRVTLTGQAASATPTPTMMVSNTRLVLANGVDGHTNKFFASSMCIKSPGWAQSKIILPFAGIYGQSNAGEKPTGNDVVYDDCWVEINGVQYNADTTSFTIASGTFQNISVTLPQGITIPANFVYRIGWSCSIADVTLNCPDGAPFALTKAQIQTPDGKGDAQFRSSSASQKANARASSGTVAAVGNISFGFAGAPVTVIGVPATPADAAIMASTGAVVMAGMSIDYGSSMNVSKYGAAHNPNWGGPMMGLAMATNGVKPFVNFCIPGTRLGDIPTVGADGMFGWAIREAILASLGNPFTHWTLGGPINDTVAGVSAATVLQRIDTAIAAMNSRGGKKGVMYTMRPNNYSTGNGYLWTQEGGGTQSGGLGTTVGYPAADAYIRGKPAGVTAIIDLYPATGSSTNYANWRATDLKSYTLTGNVAAATTNVPITLSGTTAPVVCENIVLNPQAASGASEIVIPRTVVDNGNGTWTVSQGPALSFSYTTGQTAKGIRTDDGVHTGTLGALAEAVIIDAAKPTAFAV